MRLAALTLALLGLAACRGDDDVTKLTDAGLDAATNLDGFAGDLPKFDVGPRRDFLPHDSGVLDHRAPRDSGPEDFAIISDLMQPDKTICPAPANDQCSAAQQLVWNAPKVAVSGDTNCATATLAFAQGGCNGELVDGTGGPDLFYQITLPSGLYVLKLNAALFDPALYIISGCSTSNCIDASDNLNAGITETVTLDVPSTTTFLIGVDSYDATEAGSFTLTIEGAPPPPPDGGTPDSGVDAGPPVDSGSSGGTLVITEVLADPSAIGDSAGEWFEVHNPGPSAVNIKNWTIKDQPGAGQNTHTITSDVIVQAGAYVVLSRNANASTNGGVTVSYQYSSGFDLANSADEIFLYDATGALVDQVEYSSGWPLAAGASISLKNPSLDNNVAGNWCTETTAWSGSAGDKGSPGAAAVCQ